MKAWNIFSHSVRLVWRNRWDALRISGALYAIYAVVQIALIGGQDAMIVANDELTDFDANAAGGLLFAALLQVLVTLWIAVAWHRFVLLEEYPSGWIPRFHGGSIFAYLWRSIALGLAVGLAVALPAVIIATILPVLAVFAGLLGLFFGIVLGFRFAPALPAAATGNELGFGGAWNATAGATGTAIALAVLGVVAALIVQIPIFALTSISAGLGTIAFIVVNWFVTLVSVSVLTTIYGHYVQGRAIE